MRKKIALIEHNSSKILRELIIKFPNGDLAENYFYTPSSFWDNQIYQLKKLQEVWNLWLELDNKYFANCSFLTKMEYAQKDLDIFIKNFKELSPEQLNILWNNFANFILEYQRDFKQNLYIYKKYLNKETRQILHNKVLETSGILFYSTKVEEANKILNESKIMGNIAQRYWEDGRKRKDSDPEYKNSYFLKGVSMTRSLDFALDSGGVVFIFSREGIEHHHKIQPYVWSFSFSKSPQHIKQEREDFVILHQEKDKFRNIDDPIFKKKYEDVLSGYPEDGDDFESYKNTIEEYQKKSQELSQALLKKAQGEYCFSSLDFLGFMISGDSLDIYGPEQPLIKNLLQHHKFLGVLENQKSNRYLKT